MREWRRDGVGELGRVIPQRSLTAPAACGCADEACASASEDTALQFEAALGVGDSCAVLRAVDGTVAVSAQ